MADDPIKAVEVFYSYADKDEFLRSELEKHLSLLRRQGYITNWHHRKINAGKDWKREIDSHLNTAQIILLLISPDFMASDYCYDVEVKRALERHETGEARVIPLLLRPVDWEEALFSKLQTLPTNKKPVVAWHGRYGRDKAFQDITKGIRETVKEYSATTNLQSKLLPVSEKTKEQWLAEGNSYYEAMSYEEALTAYRNAAQLDPYDARLYCNAGIVFYQLGQNQEAFRVFEKALQLDPHNASIYYNRGIALYNLKRYADALTAFEEAIKIDPDYSDAYKMKDFAKKHLNLLRSPAPYEKDKFNSFTEHARNALNLAQEEAKRFQHNYIGTEHLLLGLIREDEGLAVKILWNLGVELEKIYSSTEFIIGRGDRMVLGEIGLTPRAKKVIELAVDEARRLNHHYIGTEHLLLGLLREGEGIAAGILSSLGVQLQMVREQTIQILKQYYVDSSVAVNKGFRVVE